MNFHEPISNVSHSTKFLTRRISDDAFKLRREVSLVGGISLIVSTMIGSGIFISPKGVFRQMGSVGAGILVRITSYID